MIASPVSEVAEAPREYSREGEDDALPGGKAGGVTLRVAILCLLLGVLFGYVIPITDRQFANTYLGEQQFPPGAVMVLLILLLVINPLLRVLARRFAFSRNEILTVYITSAFAALIPGHGAENWAVPMSVGPFYFATPENGWLKFLVPHLPPWMTPAISPSGGLNRALYEGWYVGLRDGESIPWGAWMVPLLAWSSLILAAYFMLGCLSVMLRAQWGEKEALAFPLLRLPLEMTADADAKNGRAYGAFFRNPLMWCGFGLVVFVQMMNGLHLYFPDVPGVPLSIDTGPLFTELPWNQVGWMMIEVWPVAVGITYLLTAEVSFSLWFFFLFGKFQLVMAYYLGYLPATLPTPIGAIGIWTEKTFNLYQQVGAFLVYAAFPLYLARGHFKHIALRAFGRIASTREEDREALSYPAAFWGFFLCLGFMMAWSMAAGISPLVALALWISYLVLVIVLTRIVVESGLLYVLQNWTPLGTLGQLFGSGPGTWLSLKTGLVPAAFAQAVVATDIAGFLMPSFMHGFKLARDRGIHARKLFALISAVLVVTLATALWQNLRIGYHGGALSLADGWFASAGGGLTQPIKNVQALQNGAEGFSYLNWLWVAVGALVTYSLMLARTRFVGFPLHPIGYIMCLTYPIHRFWFSILIGWACKVTITRFGGTDTYRKMVPLFLGVVLGDVSMMLFWLVIDVWQGHQHHQLMPG